jgi:hypothetical protein
MADYQELDFVPEIDTLQNSFYQIIVILYKLLKLHWGDIGSSSFDTF